MVTKYAKHCEKKITKRKLKLDNKDKKGIRVYG